MNHKNRCDFYPSLKPEPPCQLIMALRFYFDLQVVECNEEKKGDLKLVHRGWYSKNRQEICNQKTWVTEGLGQLI